MHESTRVCSHCHQPRPRAEWPPSGWLRGGQCRPCRNEIAKRKRRAKAAAEEKARREAGTHVCYACGQEKPRTAFYMSAKTGAITSSCKECRAEQHRREYTPKRGDDEPRPCAYCGRVYQPKQRRVSQYCSRKCYQDQRKSSGRERTRYLERRYGISSEDYEAMLAAQGGGCALCGRRADQQGRYRSYLHVDHCHETGRIRGLLCDTHNLLLGRWEHDAALLRRAADYLEKESDV